MGSSDNGLSDEETECAGNNGANKFISDVNATFHSLYSAHMTELWGKTLSEAQDHSGENSTNLDSSKSKKLWCTSS